MASYSLLQTLGRMLVTDYLHNLIYKAKAKTAPAARAKTPEAPLTDAAPVEVEVEEEPVLVPVVLPVELEALLEVTSVLLTPETQVVPLREKGTLMSFLEAVSKGKGLV